MILNMIFLVGSFDLAPRERTPRSDTLIALGGSFMSRITRRSYTDEFKHQAVALAESLGPAAVIWLPVSGRQEAIL
ncbi:hypothetical protein TEP_17420 [Stenotrophomonas sp. TEPEL]|nr:hypothetical protein TEP_17420 [Stenotrophomonas sp. TEPEL]